MTGQITIRNLGMSFRGNQDGTYQRRPEIASGYVTALTTDQSNRLSSVTVAIPGSGQVSAAVTPGLNVTRGANVEIENRGSPSLARWAVRGASYVPTGHYGGVITNIDGVNVMDFESIWVRDAGYIRAGGSLDPDNNPTGSRTQMDETGVFGWSAYDRESFGLFTRAQQWTIGNETIDWEAGDLFHGDLEGGHVRSMPSAMSFGIYNASDPVLHFGPDGNRILKNLWVGPQLGPQVGIGSWLVDDQETAVIVARNAGSGDIDVVGNQPLWMVSASPARVVVHTGDPARIRSYMYYDSAANSGVGELKVNAVLEALAITVYGPGIVAEGGYIATQPHGTSLAGIWMRDRYLEGRGTAGDRTFLLVAASVTLDRRPNDPSYGAISWDGGEGYIGDVVYKHFRYDGRGPTGVVGFFNGEDMKVGFDGLGNGYFDGTVFASAGLMGGWSIDSTGIYTQDGDIRLDYQTGLVMRPTGTVDTSEWTNVKWRDDGANYTAAIGALVTSDNFLMIEAYGKALVSGVQSNVSAAINVNAHGGASESGATNIKAYGNGGFSNPAVISLESDGTTPTIEMTSVHLSVSKTTGQMTLNPRTAVSPLALMQQSFTTTPIMSVLGASDSGDLSRNLVDHKDVTSFSEALWIKVHIEDNGGFISTGDYYVPLYSLT